MFLRWNPLRPHSDPLRKARIMRKARSTRALEPTALTPSRTIITSTTVEWAKAAFSMGKTHGKPMENPEKLGENPWFFGCLMGLFDDFLKHVFQSWCLLRSIDRMGELMWFNRWYIMVNKCHVDLECHHQSPGDLLGSWLWSPTSGLGAPGFSLEMANMIRSWVKTPLELA